MYTLINGSQKNRIGNSRRFLEYVSEYLDEYIIYDLKIDDYKYILENIKESDSIVMAFPLYVDSPNSLTLSFLDYLYDNNIDLKEKSIYVIINCGFREGEHNQTALDIIKNWCRKVQACYSGSILIGAGEVVGNPKYKFICSKALKSLHKFSVGVSNNEQISDIITTMDLLNNKIYCMIANKSWNKKGRLNKLKKRDIKST